MATRATTKSGDTAVRGREILGIVLLALGLFLATALASLQLGDGTLMGPLGRALARLLYAGIGVAAHLLPVVLIVVPVRLLSGRRVLGGAGEAIGFGLGVVSIAILLHLAIGLREGAEVGAGGQLGELLGEVLRALVSTAGTALLAVMGLALALVVTTGLRMATLGRHLGALLARAAAAARWALIEAGRFSLEVVRAILPEPADRAERPPVPRAGPDEATVILPARGGDVRPAWYSPPHPGGGGGKIADPPASPDDTIPVAAEADGKKRRRAARPAREEDRTAETDEVPIDIDEAAESIEAAGKEPPQPVIVQPVFHKAAKEDMQQREKEMAESRPDFIPLGDGVYRLPPVSLLRYDDAGVQLDKDAMLELSARLVKTLADYGVKGEVAAIRPGPVVTMYEFAPAPGTRVAKIANLSDDLAMALEAIRVRIVAPIPGKAAVGIEVPNRTRETVYLKEIIADDVFQKAKSKLTIALGKDIEGRPVAVDLARMPHLLVAGTTGAGKSVSVNAMIMSLLFNASPEEVRVIMVDPKMLELSIYEGIPHLLLPVVTDPKKANLALRWAVEEMERRYELLAEAGVRDIASYNRRLDKRAEALEAPVVDEQGPRPEAPPPPRKLPYIVVIIDEFADLMMCAPKDVETSVARIAQKARAAGIHLLLATQRPSVDVITGLIKANFPSRVAFQVTSKIDSRTILDQSGAEALLGQGDMLFSDRGGALRRVHGCLVGDEEIQAVVEILKKQGKPVYDLDILRPRDEDGEAADAGGEDFSDDLYDRAVALVAETRQASISMIQRRLRIGYNRAARMVERMEREGVVGPADGPNRREVLIQPTA
jgi:DNA segregation ATPase FtsK/SpoIIIE, S-DNA-T family